MGSLAVTQVTQSGGSFNLATLGTTDWAHYDASLALVRKSGGGSVITVSTPGGSPASYTNDVRTFSWSGGTPTASGSDSVGTYLTPSGNYVIVVPASTSVQTLHIWLACALTQARLVATLSDGTPVYASPRVGNYLNNAPTQFAIAFAASSGGQTLTVTWTEESGAAHGGHNLAVAAIALASGDTRPAQTGLLRLAQTPVFSNNSNANGGAYNAYLTDVGTADWWQQGNTKAGGGGTITVTPVGAGQNFYNDDPRVVWWTGGTPIASSAVRDGKYVTGVGCGYTITMPADTTQRRCKLYIGGFAAWTQLIATLSDGSAAAVYSFENGLSPGDQEFDVYYRAGSASQTLTLTYVVTTDFGSGNVTVQAIATSVYPSAWYRVTSAGGTSLDNTVVTSRATSTIGATFLVAAVGSQNGATLGLTDSLSNSWTRVKSYTNIGGITGETLEIWTCANPLVGFSHTVTATCAAGSYPSLSLQAYANANAPTFDASSAGATSTSTTVSPGTLTPGVNDALIITVCISSAAAQQGITGGYVQEQQTLGASSSLASMLSTLIQATPVATNPLVTVDQTPNHIWAAQVSFGLAASGPSNPAVARRLPLLGVS